MLQPVISIVYDSDDQTLISDFSFVTVIPHY